MKCKSCKHEIDDDSIFCKLCGEKQIRSRKKKQSVSVPKPTQLPSGMWRIQLRKEGESVTEATPDLCTSKAKAIRAGFIERSKKVQAITTGTAVDNYINSNSNVLSPSTIRGYATIRRNRFQKYMDKDISSVDWQVAINEEAATVSPKTISNSWRVITASMKYAGISPPDVNLPQKAIKELPWLSYTQIQQFLEKIKGGQYEFAALLALHSLRRSEIFDLTREDITEDSIIVHGSCVPNAENKFVHKETNKNDTSTRTIPIMIPRLKEVIPDKDGFLVTCGADVITRNINKICEANGLPLVGLHGLRRSFASLAHHLKWDVRTTMRYGGWSDYKTMNDFYIKLDEADLFREAAKMIEFYSDENRE